MIPDLGPYWLEVLASYAVSLGILAGLAALIWRRNARIRRELSEMEARARAAMPGPAHEGKTTDG